MGDNFFRTGGQYDIRKSGQDQYTFSIPIDPDSDGRIARSCPDDNCSPGYFKVRFGTGIMEEQEVAYCPYCRSEEPPSDFMTPEQLRYSKEVMMREAHEGVQRMFKDELGIGASGRKKYGGGMLSIEMSLKPGRPPRVRRPFEDDVRRDLICPYCVLDHAVFGIALWFPDCGRDIFMTHLEAEYAVVRTMLDDVDRRRVLFGARVAARDLGNCLEDTVSIFEAVLKAFVRRRLREQDESEERVEEILRKRIRNGFQNIERGQEVAREYLGQELFGALSVDEIQSLKMAFEKRHPITHNLGIIDRKYIERAIQAEQEGRDIRVTEKEIFLVIEFCQKALNDLHTRMWGSD